MTTISLATALKLIRYNTDSEVASILQSALDELDRLGRVEKQAIELAKAALQGAIDRQAAWEVMKLSRVEMPTDESDWLVQNAIPQGDPQGL